MHYTQNQKLEQVTEKTLVMEAYADDSNSYFGLDETSWYWRWKGTDRDVELNFIGGVKW